MGFLTMVQEWFVVPRGNARVWFTRKVTKDAFPSPSHFVGNSQGFQSSSSSFHQRGVLRFEVRGGEILLLLFPFLSLKTSGVEGAAGDAAGGGEAGGVGRFLFHKV